MVLFSGGGAVRLLPARLSHFDLYPPGEKPITHLAPSVPWHCVSVVWKKSVFNFFFTRAGAQSIDKFSCSGLVKPTVLALRTLLIDGNCGSHTLRVFAAGFEPF